jgi:hypothetical protein
MEQAVITPPITKKELRAAIINKPNSAQSKKD